MFNNNEQRAMQRSIDNNADIYSTMQSVMVNHTQFRPTNTTIAYEERQRSFKGSKSKNDNLKDVEQKRRKVPPGTFEALDDQYSAYWSANTCKRLKLNALSLYGSYVQNNFDNLLDTIKENQNNSVPEEGRRCKRLCTRRANQINRSTFRSDCT
ncbi:unnamed protein product [Rhizopus stolonifer]